MPRHFLVSYDASVDGSSSDYASVVAIEPSDVPLLGVLPLSVDGQNVARYEFGDHVTAQSVLDALDGSAWCFLGVETGEDDPGLSRAGVLTRFADAVSAENRWADERLMITSGDPDADLLAGPGRAIDAACEALRKLAEGDEARLPDSGDEDDLEIAADALGDEARALISKIFDAAEDMGDEAPLEAVTGRESEFWPLPQAREAGLLEPAAAPAP